MWQLLKPVCPRAHAPQQREATSMRYPGTTTRELPSLATTRESPRTATKINKLFYLKGYSNRKKRDGMKLSVLY